MSIVVGVVSRFLKSWLGADMATCTTMVLNNGVWLVAIQDPPPADPSQCAGSMLLSPSEYSTYVAYTSMPSATELGQAFNAGFVLPMTAYLVAYCVGRLVSFWSDDT